MKRPSSQISNRHQSPNLNIPPSSQPQHIKPVSAKGEPNDALGFNSDSHFVSMGSSV